MFLLFPVILLVISFGVLAKAGVKSFCIATPAKEGEEALISCNFDTDINTVQKAVLLYVFKVNKSKPVFMLSWNDGNPNVTEEPGYEWGGTISNHTIIKIPKANPDHAGEYKCIVPPNDKGDVQGCTLNILGIQNDSLLTTFRTTMLAEDTEGTNEKLIAIILGLAFGVVIFVIIVLVVVAVRKRWIRFPCMRKEQQEISNPISLADRHLLSS